jgi:hypothetical protein
MIPLNINLPPIFETIHHEKLLQISKTSIHTPDAQIPIPHGINEALNLLGSLLRTQLKNALRIHTHKKKKTMNYITGTPPSRLTLCLPRIMPQKPFNTIVLAVPAINPKVPRPGHHTFIVKPANK